MESTSFNRCYARVQDWRTRPADVTWLSTISLRCHDSITFLTVAWVSTWSIITTGILLLLYDRCKVEQLQMSTICLSSLRQIFFISTNLCQSYDVKTQSNSSTRFCRNAGLTKIASFNQRFMDNKTTQMTRGIMLLKAIFHRTRFERIFWICAVTYFHGLAVLMFGMNFAVYKIFLFGSRDKQHIKQDMFI